MQRSRLSWLSQRQSQSPDVSRRPGYQAKRLRPFSHHIKHRRAQNEEVRIRDRAPIFKGLRRSLRSRRDATIYPHRMARHEFRHGKKGTSLRYIVHENETSAGEAWRRCLKVEVDKLIIVVAVDQHQVRADLFTIERRE